MSYSGITPTKFGRYACAEPFRADRLHLHDGSALKTVEWQSPIPILDQEDLGAQGIDTSALIPGAQKVDALGSCTCNAGTAHLAERVAVVHGTTAVDALTLGKVSLSTTNAQAGEEFAILLYHAVTDQTGDPAQEWPPTDCGSTGLYVMTELEKHGFTGGHKTASGIPNVVSLLQGGSVIIGSPFFNSWMDPDSQGFVDGNGTMSDLEDAIRSGVAGGHETAIMAVERLTLSETGAIDASTSHVRIRNSWSSSWGDRGSYRLHLSTLEMLGSHVDYKQAIVSPAAA